MRVLPLVLVLALAAGCASAERRQDEEKMRGYAREAAETRAAAALAASELGAEADRMQKARQGGDGQLSFERLKLGELFLETIEEAELTFGFVERFYDIREGLGLTPKASRDLDAVIDAMTAVARTVRVARVRQFAGTAGPDALARERLRQDLERDRAALRAYRTEIGLSAQLGAGPAAGGRR